ncbi:hypothetical protein [Streptomyces sp. Act143]|uniref:hypothetical protein n=1 Tax=Streptomyces sp. Act143 TaxID=2200760 RepID=UPI00215A4A7E|nr:hypothetical protein [Streptomyces sp. Act143]
MIPVAAPAALVVTATVIVIGDLFEGVLVGLALAVAKRAYDTGPMEVGTEDRGAAGVVVRVLGHATLSRLPKLLDALGAWPRDRKVRLEWGGPRHLDHACAAAQEGWAAGRGQALGVSGSVASGLVATSSSTS